MSARIVALRAAPLVLPLRRPLRWGAASELTRLAHLLLVVESDAGATGVAEAPIRPTIYGETEASMRAALAQLGPRLVGTPVDDRDAQAEALASLPFNYAVRGSLDLALHDLRAKLRGASLLELEGGPRRRIPAASILGIAPLAATLDHARAVVEAGVGTLKIKVGRDARRDRELVAALRHEFGASVQLYADANQTMDPERAAADLSELAARGLAWIEEPLPIERVRARRALRAAEILPVIADDSAFTPRDLERELELDTFDVLNVKPARSGIAASRRMIDAARDAGKGVMVGSQATSGWGTWQTAVVASWSSVTHPCELGFPLELARDSLERPLRYEGGKLALDDTDSPRLGAEFRP